MPTVNLYVTKSDKAFLDALPFGMTAAGIMRDAIARLRQGDGCDHPHQMFICPDCGQRDYSHPEPGEENAGQADAHTDVHIDRRTHGHV